MISFFHYFMDNISQVADLTIEHIQLTATAVGISILIGVPVGILISYVRKASKPVVAVANVVQAIPSMALLGLMIPLLGIGVLPAVTMVIIYALLPIIKNTYTGISSIDPQMVEAAQAIGLTPWQVLYKVKIPMALPVIMAGVRISAVTAVGTMTMAAFIGAGGLGYMVFSGIRTVNNEQILSGAIPACVLALLVDYLMGAVERLVTPVSLQPDFRGSDRTKKHRHMKEKISLVVAVLLVAGIAGNSIISGIRAEDKNIAIGSKEFTEQLVLANLYADYIEANSDIRVDRKDNLGGSQVCYEALKKGEIDMYIDYTGTIYGSIMKQNALTDMDEVYEACKKSMEEEGITLTRQCSFNNTYTLAVSKETADKYNLKTIRDVVNNAPQLRLGGTLEFMNRDDTLKALKKKYNVQFKETVGLEGAPRYTALEHKEVDVLDAFATDGMLKKYKLIVMDDTDQVFPPYYAVPMVRSDTLKKYPELEPLLDRLAPHLTDEVMQDLNYQVDVEGKEPPDVAREFLEKENLI